LPAHRPETRQLSWPPSGKALAIEILRLLNWPLKLVAFVAYRIYMALAKPPEDGEP
jgi:hypothetical protein